MKTEKEEMVCPKCEVVCGKSLICPVCGTETEILNEAAKEKSKPLFD